MRIRLMGRLIESAAVITTLVVVVGAGRKF
jgi:hypothetical protein